MKFPGRSQLPPDPYGRQITADTTRSGVVDDGNTAWPERVAEARRSWPQANPADFEKVGKRGYRDRATGVEYVAVRGAVMLNVGGEQNRGINCFLVEGGKLVFLRRPEFEEPLRGPVGYVYGQQVTSTPVPADAPRIR